MNNLWFLPSVILEHVWYFEDVWYLVIRKYLLYNRWVWLLTFPTELTCDLSVKKNNSNLCFFHIHTWKMSLLWPIERSYQFESSIIKTLSLLDTELNSVDSRIDTRLTESNLCPVSVIFWEGRGWGLSFVFLSLSLMLLSLFSLSMLSLLPLSLSLFGNVSSTFV